MNKNVSKREILKKIDFLMENLLQLREQVAGSGRKTLSGRGELQHFIQNEILNSGLLKKLGVSKRYSKEQKEEFIKLLKSNYGQYSFNFNSLFKVLGAKFGIYPGSDAELKTIGKVNKILLQNRNVPGTF